MSWDADASAFLVQARAQLVACASWTPGSPGVHYPSAAAGTTGIYAVLIDRAGDAEPIGAGATSALWNGALEIELHHDGTTAQCENLAAAIARELWAQRAGAGIPFSDAQPGIAYEPRKAEIAGGVSETVAVISMPYGLRT
jgi:hypothetical protein